MSPFFYSGMLWVLWAFSWLIAALWSRRTTARTPGRARLLDLAVSVAGGVLLGYASRMRWLSMEGVSAPFLWRLPLSIDWALTSLVAVGLAFTWWARLTLGDLWSSNVVRKEAHTVVRRGPYRLVRHPIYTGMIFAAFALAAQTSLLAGLAGALLMAVGFSIKARLEERFLSAELGEGAYADYRRTTPMLVPFWPVRR
jgi:protein-S-isoprenylcysteine O-methyltransferase Ste14